MPNDILSLIAEVDAEPVPAPVTQAPRSPLDLVAEVEAEASQPISRPMTDADRADFERANSESAARDLEQQFGGMGGKILSLPVVREARGGVTAGVKGIAQSYAQLADWLNVPGTGDLANQLGNEREQARQEVADISENSMASRVGVGLAELAPQVAEMIFAGGTIRRGVQAIPGASKVVAEQVVPRVVTAGMAAHDAATNAEHTARAEGLEGDERTNYVLRAGLIDGGITALGGLAGVEALAAGRQGMTQLKDGLVSWMRQQVPAALKAGAGEALEENAINLVATFNDFASLPSNKGRPMGEVWAQWASQIPETTLMAGIAGGGARLLSQAPRADAPYEVTPEQQAALAALSPDTAQVTADPNARTFERAAEPQTPPVSVTQERIDLERQRPAIESPETDPRLQRLLDEETEGAELPRQIAEQEDQAATQEQRADYEWRKGVASRLQEGKRAKREAKQAEVAKDEQWKAHVAQQLRQRRTGEVEPEQIPNPYTVEEENRAQALVDAARTAQQERAATLSIEEGQALEDVNQGGTDVAGRGRAASTGNTVGDPVLEAGRAPPAARPVAADPRERSPLPAVRPAQSSMSRPAQPGTTDPLSTSQPRQGGPAPARPPEAARPAAVRVRSVADLDRGFREVYRLKPKESAAALALVRARAASLGEDPDAYVARTISEVRQGKGAAGDSALMQEGVRIIPRDESLEFDKLQRQWQKAHGERPQRGSQTWQQLEEQARAIDEANGILYQEDVGRLSDAPKSAGTGKRVEKGAISFAQDGRAVLHALESPNASTAFHELGHSFRRTLPPREMEYAGRWAGARKKPDGTYQWTRPAEEKFARGFERYLRDGTAPTPILRQIFDQMREWMRNLYQAIKGGPIDVDLNPDIRAVFDRMLTPKDAANADRLAKGLAMDEQRASSAKPDSVAPPSPVSVPSEPEIVPSGARNGTNEGTTGERSAPSRERPPAIDEREPPAREQVEDNPPTREKSSTPPAEKPRTPDEPPKNTRETPLAIPSKDEGERKTIADLDKKREQPERRDQENIHQQAARAVANDHAGERKRILAASVNGDVLSDYDTAVAQELLRRDTQQAMATGSATDLRNLAAMHAAYRDSGTEQARALAIRRDPAETPNRRRLRMVTDAILTPPARIRKDMAKARADIRKAQEGGHKDDALRAQERLAKLTARAEKRLERVRSFFKREGIDLLYQGENAEYIAGMANAASKANGTFNGALREYWINSILSGPRSVVVNAAAVNAMWKLGVDRFAEAALNSVRGGKNLDAATLTEYRIMWKGLLPGLMRGLQNAVRSFVSERPIFGEDLQDSTQFDQYGPQIKGTWGRIVRLPSRLLLAADQFNKTWSANVEVMAQAYRLARKQLGADAGEAALTKRTQELVEDLESPAWDKAKEQATEWAFQEDVPEPITAVYKVRDAAVPGTDLRPFFYVLPFVKTPTNIIRQGVAASPLGMARLLWKLGNQYAGNGTYEQSALARDAAQQMVSWGVSLGLMALAGMEDEEGRPYLTGSEGAYNKGKAGLQQETMQPYTLRIPGTDTELDYRRIEPFATWFGMVADGTRIAKRAANGENVGDTLKKLKDAVAAQVLDKSMLKSLSDIYQAFAPGGDSDPSNWARSFATSWIPNVVRAPLRDQDNTVREQGVWGEGADFWKMYFKRIGQSVAPMTQTPRINLLGDEVTKADAGPVTDTIARMSRLVSPSVITGSRTPPDLYRWLTNWNNDPTNKGWFPTPPAKSYQLNGERRYFTEQQYEKVQREAGRLLKDALAQMAKDGNAINPEKPTDTDRKVIERLISRARRAARVLVLNGESASEDDVDEPAAGE